MRKPQSQPSLGSLTEADRDQLADWLRHGEYKDVLERVNKPHPDGFALTMRSEKPLRTFYAKVALLDLINSRLSDEKKLTLATFESLAHGEILLSPAADTAKITEAHDAILDTTLDLAKSGNNTPGQLLSLQRLADFPARAALRAQRAELDIQKAERQCETHSWKREMHAHKIEMDTFRKQIATERLKLAQQAAKLHEEKLNRDALQPKVTPSRGNPSPYPQGEDELGPLLKGWHDREGLSARVRKAFNISDEEAARREEIWRKFRSGELKHPDHCGTADFQAACSTAAGMGKPSPGNAELRSEVSPTCSQQPPGQPAALPEHPPLPPANVPPTGLSALSAPSASPSRSDNSFINSDLAVNSSPSENNQSREDLSSIVEAYTVGRAEEYCAHARTYTPWPHRHSPPEYITGHRHCPCGAASPCPTHENEETYGRFPGYFWKLSPFDTRYAACLLDHGLPYRNPTEFLA